MITLKGKSYRLRERGTGIAPQRGSLVRTFRCLKPAHFRRA
jgi:hypothetical protein